MSGRGRAKTSKITGEKKSKGTERLDIGIIYLMKLPIIKINVGKNESEL